MRKWKILPRPKQRVGSPMKPSGGMLMASSRIGRISVTDAYVSSMRFDLPGETDLSVHPHTHLDQGEHSLQPRLARHISSLVWVFAETQGGGGISCHALLPRFVHPVVRAREVAAAVQFERGAFSGGRQGLAHLSASSTESRLGESHSPSYSRAGAGTATKRLQMKLNTSAPRSCH